MSRVQLNACVEKYRVAELGVFYCKRGDNGWMEGVRKPVFASCILCGNELPGGEEWVVGQLLLHHRQSPISLIFKKSNIMPMQTHLESHLEKLRQNLKYQDQA